MSTEIKIREYSGRKLHLEFLKVFSILLIIFTHTGNRGFALFTQATDSVLYPFYLFSFFWTRPSLILFWMCSGAVLIDHPEESLRKIWEKRVLRMAAVLVLFSALQFLHAAVTEGEKPDLYWFIVALYTGKIKQYAPAYWYLYAYIGILIMLPAVRKLVKSLSDKELLYIIVISVFFRGFMHMAEYIMFRDYTISADFLDMLLPMNLVSFIAGYYFECRIKPEQLNRKTAVIGLAVSLLGLIAEALLTQYRINLTGIIGEGHSQYFVTDLAHPLAFAIFYTARLVFTKYKIGQRFGRIISTLGGTCFGVMLLENILRDRLDFIFTGLCPYLHTFLACVVWVWCVWICGVLITLVLKKLPVFKKLL